MGAYYFQYIGQQALILSCHYVTPYPIKTCRPRCLQIPKHNNTKSSFATPAEGERNKVFRFVMNNVSAIILDIPCPNADLEFKTTASEVAGMEFIELDPNYKWKR